jgi:hypothetical protein
MPDADDKELAAQATRPPPESSANSGTCCTIATSRQAAHHVPVSFAVFANPNRDTTIRGHVVHDEKKSRRF